MTMSHGVMSDPSAAEIALALSHNSQSEKVGGSDRANKVFVITQMSSLPNDS